jgi:hypothetical protein
MCYRDCECTRGIRRLESAGVWQPVRRLIPRIVILSAALLASFWLAKLTASLHAPWLVPDESRNDPLWNPYQR